MFEPSILLQPAIIFLINSVIPCLSSHLTLVEILKSGRLLSWYFSPEVIAAHTHPQIHPHPSSLSPQLIQKLINHESFLS
jgi:hypothetical protein